MNINAQRIGGASKQLCGVWSTHCRALSITFWAAHIFYLYCMPCLDA